MKRTVLLVTLLMVLVPSPAFAWFGWLDALSGPGPWFGALFEFRLKCFGPIADKSTLQALTAVANGLASSTPNARTPNSWLALEKAWDAAFSAAQTDPGLRALLGPRDLVLLSNLRMLLNARGLVPDVESLFAATPRVVIPDEVQKKVAEDVKAQVDAFNENVEGRQRLAGGIGVIVENCGNVVRRSSIDVAADVWLGTKRTPEFANGEGIQLYTFRVAYSYALVRNPRYNIVDGAIGAGLFVFRSDGFDDDDGFSDQRRNIFIEPLRLYIHAPAHWADDGAAWWKQLLAAPVISPAVTLFPRGFDPNVFGQHDAIGPELVPSVSVYVNARTLFRR